MNLIEKDGKQLRLPATLWVQHGDVKISRKGEDILVEGKNEDAYLKILNHFGRVLKLFTFESGIWEDAETGGLPTGFDTTLAGWLKEAPSTTQSASTKKKAAPEKKIASPKSSKKTTVGKNPSPIKETSKTDARKKPTPKKGTQTAAGKKKS